MAYLVVADTVMMCSYGLYRYDLYISGLYSYGLYSYGRNSYLRVDFFGRLVVGDRAELAHLRYRPCRNQPLCCVAADAFFLGVLLACRVEPRSVYLDARLDFCVGSPYSYGLRSV